MIKNAFTALKGFMFRSYGTKEGLMLIHLGALGWLLSSLAQTIAIVTNKSISPKEKKYMVPQEIADGVINVGCYYGITKVFQNVANRMIDKGKIIFKEANGSIMNANQFKSPVSVLAVIAGSVISCNILTPLLRNVVATLCQRKKKSPFNENSACIKYYTLYNQKNNPLYKNNRLSNFYSAGMKI